MARRKPSTVHGLAIVDKPAGVTSHDVVDRLRRRFGERRVGHAGTLDPGATGVLVVGVGTVTRLLRFVTEGRKRYTGEIVLGTETDTLDADGRPTVVRSVDRVGLDVARATVAANLVGEIEQVPPMVSALKHEGRRLHAVARDGIEVERPPRPVTVHRFDIVGETAAEDGAQALQVEVDCGAGTYVRSLAADLGTLLGTGAHLRNLRRIAVEPFTIEEAAPPAECELLAPIAAVRALDLIGVDAEKAAVIAVGGLLPAPAGDGPWAMVNDGSRLLAVYEPFGDGLAKPAVVLPAAFDD